MLSSQYLNEQRKEYAVYVLCNRALPSIIDGLKPASRRLLWTARSGNKWKSASLAGAAMPLHPHSSPEGSVNTLAGPYINNIQLLNGYGAFGSLINPTSFAASRYTSVDVSAFTKDAMFKDIEIIKMADNYDSTLLEPVTFLPIVPVVLINPTDGIAMGFATSILPRSLKDVIKQQINHLSGRSVKDILPYFRVTDNKAIAKIHEDPLANPRYTFEGVFERLNSFEVNVSKLPYGQSHDKFIAGLNKLEENGDIKDYEDSSSSTISVKIKFPRGYLNATDDKTLLKRLNLIKHVSENLTMIDFDGTSVIKPTVEDLIVSFTDFRLKVYKDRYIRLDSILNDDIRKLKDVLLAIEKKIGAVAPKVKSKIELKQLLEALGIVNTDYIADLPVYRFTEQERLKTEKKLAECLELAKVYQDLIVNSQSRVDKYIEELKFLQRKYC